MISVTYRCDIEGYEVLGKVTMDISKNNREEGSVSLTVTHCVDTQSGSHALRLSCPLWVYNCTSLPIAVKQIVGQDQKFGHVDEVWSLPAVLQCTQRYTRHCHADLCCTGPCCALQCCARSCCAALGHAELCQAKP